MTNGVGQVYAWVWSRIGTFFPTYLKYMASVAALGVASQVPNWLRLADPMSLFITISGAVVVIVVAWRMNRRLRTHRTQFPKYFGIVAVATTVLGALVSLVWLLGEK